MVTGVVKAWLPDRGFGFITMDGGDQAQDVFVHMKQLPRGVRFLEPGVRVQFEVCSTDRGPQAEHVQVAGATAVRTTQNARTRERGSRPDVITEQQLADEVHELGGLSWDALVRAARKHGWVR